DRDVPVRVPQLHRGRDPHPGRAGPGRRRRRGAGGARGPGLLRRPGPAGRRRRRRGRRLAQADGQLLVVVPWPEPEPADDPALLQPDRYRRRSSVMGEPRRAASGEPVGRPYLSEGEAVMEEFTLGARASCPDGFCGVVRGTIVDLAARTVTHLVIE